MHRWKKYFRATVYLWFLGWAVLGVRWLLLSFNPSFVEYTVDSIADYVLPVYLFVVSATTILIFLKENLNRMEGKRRKSGEIILRSFAFWIFPNIAFLPWVSSYSLIFAIIIGMMLLIYLLLPIFLLSLVEKRQVRHGTGAS